VTLITNQIPIHNHAMLCTTNVATQQGPNNAVLGQSTLAQMYIADSTDSTLAANAITVTGGSQPHDNMQPFLCINFIISLFGVFPSQT
jgi:microcystin-dependent protein